MTAVTKDEILTLVSEIQHRLDPSVREIIVTANMGPKWSTIRQHGSGYCRVFAAVAIETGDVHKYASLRAPVCGNIYD